MGVILYKIKARALQYEIKFLAWKFILNHVSFVVNIQTFIFSRRENQANRLSLLTPGFHLKKHVNGRHSYRFSVDEATNANGGWFQPRSMTKIKGLKMIHFKKKQAHAKEKEVQ